MYQELITPVLQLLFCFIKPQFAIYRRNPRCAKMLYWWTHGLLLFPGRRLAYVVDRSSTGTVQTRTHCSGHKMLLKDVRGRPTLKDEERFRNGLVRKNYERSLYERTFEWTFHRETSISTELCNVNRMKHKLKSHRVCRRDREPSRIPIRSLKSLRNKSRKVGEFVYARILSCFPMFVLLCKC